MAYFNDINDKISFLAISITQAKLFKNSFTYNIFDGSYCVPLPGTKTLPLFSEAKLISLTEPEYFALLIHYWYPFGTHLLISSSIWFDSDVCFNTCTTQTRHSWLKQRIHATEIRDTDRLVFPTNEHEMLK